MILLLPHYALSLCLILCINYVSIIISLLVFVFKICHKFFWLFGSYDDLRAQYAIFFLLLQLVQIKAKEFSSLQSQFTISLSLFSLLSLLILLTLS